MHFVRAADGARGSLGQSEVADFSGAHQLGHRAHCFFDGHGGIDAVLVIQVNSFHAQALQTVVAARADVFWSAVDTAHRGISFASNDAEFRGEKSLVAQAANGFADQDFVVTEAVDIRRIKKGDAEFGGAMNRGNGFRVVTRSIEFGHSHAAETHCRD